MLKVELIGNIGKDAVIKEFGGIKKISYNVVTTKRVRNSDGELKEQDTWVSCLQTYHEGSRFPEYLKKGAKVFIRGDLRVNLFTGSRGLKSGISCDVDQSEILVPADGIQLGQATDKSGIQESKTR